MDERFFLKYLSKILALLQKTSNSLLSDADMNKKLVVYLMLGLLVFSVSFTLTATTICQKQKQLGVQL